MQLIWLLTFPKSINNLLWTSFFFFFNFIKDINTQYITILTRITHLHFLYTTINSDLFRTLKSPIESHLGMIFCCCFFCLFCSVLILFKITSLEIKIWWWWLPKMKSSPNLVFFFCYVLFKKSIKTWYHDIVELLT